MLVVFSPQKKDAFFVFLHKNKRYLPAYINDKMRGSCFVAEKITLEGGIYSLIYKCNEEIPYFTATVW